VEGVPFASILDMNQAAVVVAHPDDEILWFSSIAAKVERIVMCYGAISPSSARAARRRNVIRAYPLRTVEFLDLPLPVDASEASEMHRALVDRLAGVLRGATTVFTHNPWGEYGQRDHQRVHAAVVELRDELKFTVYISCYAARHQLTEVASVLKGRIGNVITLPIDRSEVDPILALYKSSSCWTWSPSWRWPSRERFLCLDTSVPPGETDITLHVFGSRTKNRAEMRRWWRALFLARTRELAIRC
jgi:LmbE family N-acetylglucosaminyl deacetylase